MSVIVKAFVRAKHWQVFVLLFGLLVVSFWVQDQPFDPPGRGSTLAWVMMAVWTLAYMGWLWGLGSFLATLEPRPTNLASAFFSLGLVYVVLYGFAFIAIFDEVIPVPPAVLIPMHLLAMFCMLYGLNFVAKRLVLAEAGKATSFYEYAGPFFLIWFLPVGIWFLQPRINRLYAQMPRPNHHRSDGAP